MTRKHRNPRVCVLGSAEPGPPAYELAGQAGEALAKLGITVVSGCGSPATRVAAERARWWVAAGGPMSCSRVLPMSAEIPGYFPGTLSHNCGKISATSDWFRDS